MSVYRIICDCCGASMRRTGTGTDAAFVCPYCGNKALPVESDAVRIARTRMDYDYRKHSDFLAVNRKLLWIRSGIILIVFLLVLYLWIQFMG